MTPDQLHSLLAELGVKRLHRASTGELRGCCPVHHDSNPSWAANPFTPGILCNCFACNDGKGPLQKIVAKVLNVSWKEARRFIERFGFYDEIEFSGAPEKSHQAFHKTTFAFYEKARPSRYLLKRGIPQKIQEFCRIGIDGNRVLIPWTENDEIVGIEERRSDDKTYKGMYYPFERADYLYAPMGLDSRRLILTEGALDVMRAYALGIRGIAATGTASISERQIEIVKRMNPEYIVAAFDNDRAGYNASCRVFNVFGDSTVVLLMPFPKGVKDIGEFRSAALLNEALSRAEVASIHLPKKKKYVLTVDNFKGIFKFLLCFLFQGAQSPPPNEGGPDMAPLFKRSAPAGGAKGAGSEPAAKESSAAPSWMFRGAEVEKALKEYEREQAQNARKNTPEIYLMDGTDIQLCFLDKQELCLLWRYYYEKRYYTKPGDPTQDMFMAYNVDVRANPHKIYEVVNLSGYTDREGKHHPEAQVRFLVATSNAMRTRLEKLAEKHGNGSLEGLVLQLTVDGKGKERVVTFDYERTYEGDPLRHNGAKLTRMGMKKVQECYAPLTIEEQKLILGM